MRELKNIAEGTKEERDEYLNLLGWDGNPFVGAAGPEEFVVPDEGDIADVTAALQNYTGPVVIHSPYSGAGKTTLLQVILEEFGENHTTALLGEHNVSSFELVGIIADEIGVGKSNSTKMTEQKIRNAMEDWEDDPVLVGVDEFGLNEPETLHSLQFLSDLGVKIVMTGMSAQWNAVEGIGSAGKAFKRRVSYELELDTMTREQAGELVKRRLAPQVGTTDLSDVPLSPFSEDAIDTVYEESSGVPGVMVSALAELVSLGAYHYAQTGDETITTAHAEAADYADGDIESTAG